LEALAQSIEIGKLAGREIRVDCRGELPLACAVMGECEQAHHGATSVLVAGFGQQLLDCPCIGAARDQLVAIDQIEQGHRLSAQGMNNVAVLRQPQPARRMLLLEHHIPVGPLSARHWAAVHAFSPHRYPGHCCQGRCLKAAVRLLALRW
jgi:hypothetical protein